MLRSRALSLGLVALTVATLQTGCQKQADGSWKFVGQPSPNDVWKPTEDVTDFKTLFSQNCQACHGLGSVPGAAVAMDNPIYLSVTPEATIRNAITNGVKNTLMPAFSDKLGGSLTDKQLDIVVKGILANKPATPAAGLPTYSAAPGNAENGKALFAQSFAKNLPPEKTYLNPSFLALVSDQYIRTLVIAGLPELGYPDYRNFIPGRALTDQEVSDVTAWIISNRQNEFGKPIAPQTAAAAATPGAVTPQQ